VPLPLDLDTPQAADSVGNVDRIRIAQVVFMQRALFDFRPRGQQMSAVDAAQQSTRHRGRAPAAVLLHEHIADGALGEFAAHVEEEHIREAGA
jgi:hypothetical protein